MTTEDLAQPPLPDASQEQAATLDAGGDRAALRVMVVWCPDWPVVAAVLDAAETGEGSSKQGVGGRNTPIAVFAAHRVQACNASARAEGVRRGMRRRDAQARCPELVLIDANPDRDARMFAPVLAELEQLRPEVAPIRPGLVALRAPGRFYGGEDRAAAVFAERLVEAGVWDARIGIADDLFTAEQAARRARIQEHLIVPAGGSARFLAGLPIEALDGGLPAARPGEGKDLVGLLRRLGITRLGEFAALPAGGVAARFGADGARVHRLLQGRSARPLAVRTPPPEREVEIAFEPPLADSEAVCFSVRQTAERFVAGLAADQLVCTMVHVTAETDRGTISARSWAHAGWFSSVDLIDRVHWQLEGAAQARQLDGPIARVRFSPDTVESMAAHAEALWGSGSDDRVERGIAKVQAMIGYDQVLRPVRQGGRAPSDRQSLVPWGERSAGLRPVEQPWPGRVPAPAPSRVYPQPFPARLVDPASQPVRVDGRGALTATPALLDPGDRLGGESGWLPVLSWAGPWPADEGWWAESPAGLVMRCQVVARDGRAWLLRYAGSTGGWVTEAAYD